MNYLKTDILIVGAGTGGTVAAIQAARRGATVMLVSENVWLGGMLTSGGVSVPDGNELKAWQTGMWGKFLQELQIRQKEGLDHAWVSFFAFDPRLGQQIFTDWLQALPNLKWLKNQTPLAIIKSGNQVTGVQFNEWEIQAKIIIDGTELGDLLALAEIPHRWGWEWQSEWQEPSAPISPNHWTETYPVQAPTYVVLMQDYGMDNTAPEISLPPVENFANFQGAWDNYSVTEFLNYGRLPGGLIMLNWPQNGNDYGVNLQRLITSEQTRQEFIKESFLHSWNFAKFIQVNLGKRYGLARNIFPISRSNHHDEWALTQLEKTAYALHPYYRESRRLCGLRVIKEQDILPIEGGKVAKLPINNQGICEAIAIGNYANDHHYPNWQFSLKSKSIRWGGRWTGTPFTIPYQSLIPIDTDGFLVCEKNISVSHIANGATRLQPVVMNIGQAIGMAAALCIEKNCQPRHLSVKDLQLALLQDQTAPAAIIPLFNITLDHPDWLQWQLYYLDHPEHYPIDGYAPVRSLRSTQALSPKPDLSGRKNAKFSGIFHRQQLQDYQITFTAPEDLIGQTWKLVTLSVEVDQIWQDYPHEQPIELFGKCNYAGHWLLVTECVGQ